MHLITKNKAKKEFIERENTVHGKMLEQRSHNANFNRTDSKGQGREPDGTGQFSELTNITEDHNF